jgi:mevalonate kinase
MSKIKTITAIAPGKIILSGEHAVIYQNPALAMAVNLFATTNLTILDTPEIIFELDNLNYRAIFTKKELLKLKTEIDLRYQKFLRGEILINHVLGDSQNLVLYTFISFLEKLKINFDLGMKIKISSQIPIGSGLGSSAAIIISLFTALAAFFELKSDIDLFPLGKEIENLQHGKSSGLDLYLAKNGGLIFFGLNKVTRLDNLSFPFLLINTGTPKNSTGECIAHASKYLAKKEILSSIKEVTLGLIKALKENDLFLWKEKIKANHFLLKEIGLVPKKVADFVQEIEFRSGSAKISGAGAISGDSAGMVIVFGDLAIDNLIEKFGFSKLIVAGENGGAKTI